MKPNPYAPPDHSATANRLSSTSQHDVATAHAESKEEIKHSLECIYLIRDASRLAVMDPELSPGKQATAAGICRIVLELAVDQYGAEGKDVLMEWGIQTSRDVETVVNRLRNADLLDTPGYESLGSFDEWFDLRQPAETWKLSW